MMYTNTTRTSIQRRTPLIKGYFGKKLQIIDDPPAFSKNKDSLKKAYRGYKEINMQAMKIIKSGGYLLTFSCSQHMTPDLFMQMINEAAHDAKRTVQFLDFRIQAPDHPALLQSEEQLYLKCMILRVK